MPVKKRNSRKRKRRASAPVANLPDTVFTINGFPRIIALVTKNNNDDNDENKNTRRKSNKSTQKKKAQRNRAKRRKRDEQQGALSETSAAYTWVQVFTDRDGREGVSVRKLGDAFEVKLPVRNVSALRKLVRAEMMADLGHCSSNKLTVYRNAEAFGIRHLPYGNGRPLRADVQVEHTLDMNDAYMVLSPPPPSATKPSEAAQPARSCQLQRKGQPIVIISDEDECEANGLQHADRVVYDGRHGGPYDRGSSDSYYRRGRRPHYYTGHTQTPSHPSYVPQRSMTKSQVEAYYAGFREHHQNPTAEFKEYGDEGSNRQCNGVSCGLNHVSDW
jgi:hypothetical protein